MQHKRYVQYDHAWLWCLCGFWVLGGWAGCPGSPGGVWFSSCTRTCFLSALVFIRICRSNQSSPDYSATVVIQLINVRLSWWKPLCINSSSCAPSVCSSIVHYSLDFQAKGFSSPLWIPRHLPARPTVDSVLTSPQPVPSPPYWRPPRIQ